LEVSVEASHFAIQGAAMRKHRPSRSQAVFRIRIELLEGTGGLADWISGWSKRQRSEVLGDAIPHLLTLVAETAPPKFMSRLYDSLKLSLSMRP
jgi:hypothetical protein